MKNLDIQVGDRVIYRVIVSDETIETLVADNEDVNNIQEDIQENRSEILKIERIGSNGWYTVYEKKDLLTNEERVFLKYYTKYLKLQEKEEMIRVRKESSEICFSVNDSYRKYLYQKYL